MMNSTFMFDNKWCIKITPDNLEYCKTLQNNELGRPENYDYIKNCFYPINAVNFPGIICTNWTEIPFEQFKFNIENFILKEDYSYLIPILIKHNII